MKVLITSGGTKVPIDDVRDITNMSKGTFGSKIAQSFLNLNHNVHLFRAIESKSPFKFEMNYHPLQSDLHLTYSIGGWNNWCSSVWDHYSESTYRNFDDYLNGLKLSIQQQNPDVVVLAAAVSDYVVTPLAGKVRSSGQLEIKLEKAEKVISKIKEWAPSVYLVGFKLLVDVSDKELIAEAQRSIEQNKCDLVIANDFNSLKAGHHRLLAVCSDSSIEVVDADQANKVTEIILKKSQK